MKVTYRIYPDAESLAGATAIVMADAIKSAYSSRGWARIAVSGGNTPRAAFESLAANYKNDLPWDKVQLFFVDERNVGPNDKDSNYRMTREALLKSVPISPAHVYRMEGELPAQEAADRYEATLRDVLKLEGAEVPVFDLVMLGMGDDGHTASLFPHTAALDELMRLVTANEVPQKQTWRITLTWPVINRARDVVFLIAGADKAAPLASVMLGKYEPEQLPSQLIRPTNGKLLLLLDEAAAARLPAPAADASGVKTGTLEIAR